ncbi:MAG: stage II sporulation protein M [Thermoleophilaceae bacterium]|nr:stage II sporulation protein M [Thermoleophilaceae bacterium]
MGDTRATLRLWNEHAVKVVGTWLLISLCIAGLMMASVLVVSWVSTPQVTMAIPNLLLEPHLADAARVFKRNVLVLALHAFICLAGFMAMRTLPAQAKLRTGVDRFVHHHAGRFTMLFVSAATLFSISTQVYVLGHQVADLALTLHLKPVELLLTVLPHALLELTAMFLPLAAFLVCSMHKRWNELLAATVVTVAVALPMLVVAGLVEAYVWPTLLSSAVF